MLGSRYNSNVLCSGSYDCSADIWSLGITLLEFALGQAPLQNCNLDQILMKTLNEPPPILESSDRRKRFTEVLRQLQTYFWQHTFISCGGSHRTDEQLGSAILPSLVLNCEWCKT